MNLESRIREVLLRSLSVHDLPTPAREVIVDAFSGVEWSEEMRNTLIPPGTTYPPPEPKESPLWLVDAIDDILAHSTHLRECLSRAEKHLESLIP